MEDKKEILTIDEIKILVDDFYGKVRKDELLKDIFEEVIQDTWPQHLDKMYRFWQTILLGERTYYGSPFMHHINLPVEEKHFNRWLSLFYETLDENFEGEKAEQAKMQSMRMAQMFQYKIQYYRENSTKPIV